jgi:gas vesicle protein
MDDKNSGLKFIAGVVVGAAVGYAIATLLKSDEGKELLAKVSDTIKKTADGVKDAFGKAGNAVDDIYEDNA